MFLIFLKNHEAFFVKKCLWCMEKSENIKFHENSIYHKKANTTWLIRENSSNSVNQQMNKQISTETQ